MFDLIIEKVSVERLVLLIIFIVLLGAYSLIHRDNFKKKVNLYFAIKLLLPLYTLFAGLFIGYAWLIESKELAKVIPNSELLLIATVVLVGNAIGEFRKLFSKSELSKNLGAVNN